MNDIPEKVDIEPLVKLQVAETEIVRLREVLDTIETEKIKLSLQLKTFGKAFKENQEKLSSIQKSCRDIENEIQVVDQRIIRSNENLRMVKTNKEYQLLLREVDDNRKRKDGLETELLEYFDDVEEIETIVQESEAEYTALKDKIKTEQQQIDEQSIDDKEMLEEYLNKQSEIGETLDSKLMSRFLRISKMNQGLAVVQVQNEVCLGCYMNIPPQLYIEVQRGTSLISCPQCSRILYYDKSEG